MMGMGGAAGSSPFTVVSQSYVSTSKTGPDGKVVQQKYVTNNVAQRGMDGQVISEKKQAYRNSNGIDRIGHERMLNDKGRKLVRERNRNTGEEEQTNHFHNMDYDEVESFDRQWNGYSQKNRFADYGKYIQGGMPRGRAIMQQESDYRRPERAREPEYPEEARRRKDIQPTLPGRNVHAEGDRAIGRRQAPRVEPRAEPRAMPPSRGSHQGGVYKNTLGKGNVPRAG